MWALSQSLSKKNEWKTLQFKIFLLNDVDKRWARLHPRMLLISNFDSFFPDPWRKEEQKVTDELQNNCIYNLKSLFFFFFKSGENKEGCLRFDFAVAHLKKNNNI